MLYDVPPPDGRAWLPRLGVPRDKSGWPRPVAEMSEWDVFDVLGDGFLLLSYLLASGRIDPQRYLRLYGLETRRRRGHERAAREILRDRRAQISAGEALDG